MNFIKGLNLGCAIILSIDGYWNLTREKYIFAILDFLVSILNFMVFFN